MFCEQYLITKEVEVLLKESDATAFHHRTNNYGFRAINLQNENLSNKNLNVINLQVSRLSGVNLSGQSLIKADLSGVNLRS